MHATTEYQHCQNPEFINLSTDILWDLSDYIANERIEQIRRIDDSICGAWNSRYLSCLRGSDPEAGPVEGFAPQSYTTLNGIAPLEIP